MLTVESISAGLRTDQSVMDLLSKELKTFLTSSAGLDAKCAVLNKFGFCNISPDSVHPHLIELCSYGRPSEDFRLTWYYDTKSQEYAMFHTPYPSSHPSDISSKDQVELHRASTLALFLDHVNKFNPALAGQVGGAQ